MWQVSWKGYNASETSWLQEDALRFDNFLKKLLLGSQLIQYYLITSGCIELLSEYNSRNQIFGNEIDNHHHPLLKRDKCTTKSKPRTSGPVALAENLSSLIKLLSLSALQAELKGVEDAYASPKSKEYYPSMTTSAMVDLWSKQLDQSTLLGDVLAVLPKASIQAAHLQFQMLQNAVEILATMDVEMQKIDVIKHAFHYETCLSLVKVFEWYCYIGPATTQHLM